MVHKHYISRGKDFPVGNGKQRAQPQNYNSILQKNPNPPRLLLAKKITNLKEIKEKSKKILILTDSMLKTLRMGEFSQFEGKAYLKSLHDAKAKATKPSCHYTFNTTSV